MTPGPIPRKAGVVLLAAAAALAFWAGWALRLVPHGTDLAVLGAGMLSAVFLLMIDAEAQVFRGLAGVLLGLCPPAALLLTLATAEDLISVAGGLGLWTLVLSLFAALLALSMIPGMATRLSFTRAGLVLGLGLMLAHLLGGEGLVDRWVLQTPVHLLITYAAVLVLSAQARVSVLGSPEADEARLTRGIAHMLPLLGFAGTIWGIMIALAALPEIFATDPPSTEALQVLLGGLATAFETTLLGLAAAVVIAVIDLLLPDPDPRP